jgi:hypothetical protein
MPTGISQSVINPGSLAPRSGSESTQQARREPAAAAGAGAATAQSATAAGPGEQLVRAPEPEAGSQGVENQMPASAGAAAAQGREPLAQATEAQPGNAAASDGLGGILDVSG